MSALPAESHARRLGEILLARGKLDAPNLERALRLQEGDTREKLGVILSRLGLVSARDLADALSEQTGIPIAAATEFPELPLLEGQISDRFLRDAKALPVRETDDGIVVAMADPWDAFTVRAIEMVCGKRVLPRLAITTELEAGLERLYVFDRHAGCIREVLDLFGAFRCAFGKLEYSHACGNGCCPYRPYPHSRRPKRFEQ